MDDERAVEGLTRLGLTTYEARVFVALQKLGSGTASEVSEVSDVPRSQVYGAAEGLEERGLVETRQSTPTVYRPADLDVARQRLLERLAETGDRTFEYLDTVRGSVGDRERSEDIWLVNGADAVVSRTTDLVDPATEWVVYGVDDPTMLEEVQEPLHEAAERGVEVLVASADPAVREAVASPLRAVAVPEHRQPDVATGRVLLVDGETILMSVFSAATDDGDGEEEVAFWSAGSSFAAVLVEFIEEWLTLDSNG